MRFEELNLSTPLLEAVAQLDFTEMTEIQEKAIPLPEKPRRSVSRFWSKWDSCRRRNATVSVP